VTLIALVINTVVTVRRTHSYSKHSAIVVSRGKNNLQPDASTSSGKISATSFFPSVKVSFVFHTSEESLAT